MSRTKQNYTRTLSTVEAWERARNPSFGVGYPNDKMTLGGQSLLDEVYSLSRSGCRLDTIAAALGVTLQVLKEYFDTELGLDAKLINEKAKAEAILEIEQNAFELAQTKDVKAVKFWLESKHPEAWKIQEEQKVEKTFVFIEPREKNI